MFEAMLPSILNYQGAAMLEDPIALSALIAGIAVVVLLSAVVIGKAMPGKTALPGWFAGLVIGVVIGGGAAVATGRWLGLEARRVAEASSTSPPSGPPGGGMGGMMGGGMMGGGGGGSRRLTSLIGELDLLTQGVKIDLSAEQKTHLAAMLSELASPETLTADEIDQYTQAIEAVLTDEQRTALDSIDLPRPRPAGGGMGMMAMGPGGMGAGGMVRGGMGPAAMGPGAMGPEASPPPAANPFKEETNSKRLGRLLTYVASADAVAEISQSAPSDPSGDLPVREDVVVSTDGDGSAGAATSNP
jgi:hypothetical protein